MASSGASTVDYDAEMLRLEEKMKENIKNIRRIGRSNLVVATELGAPPEVVELVERAVADSKMTDELPVDVSFTEFLKCQLPTFRGTIKAAALTALKVAFDLAMVAYTMTLHNYDQNPWDEAAAPMCSRNNTWPVNPLPPPAPMMPEEIMEVPGGYVPMAAQPKGMSVVDAVFTKEVEARARARARALPRRA